MSTYTIVIEDNYVASDQPFADNAAYISFVMSMAADSYRKQYNVDDAESGITAAREAYNASLPPAPPPEE